MAHSIVMQIWRAGNDQWLCTYYLNLSEFMTGCSGGLLFCGSTLGILGALENLSDHSITVLTTSIGPSCPFLIPKSSFLWEAVSCLKICLLCSSASMFSKSSDESAVLCLKSPFGLGLVGHAARTTVGITRDNNHHPLKVHWGWFSLFFRSRV